MAKKAAAKVKNYLVTRGIQDDSSGARIEAGQTVSLDELKEWPETAIKNWLKTGVLREVTQ